jgi:hypothetical protein
VRAETSPLAGSPGLNEEETRVLAGGELAHVLDVRPDRAEADIVDGVVRNGWLRQRSGCLRRGCGYPETAPRAARSAAITAIRCFMLSFLCYSGPAWGPTPGT